MGIIEVDFEKRRPRSADRASVKYRLDVVASSPADVVCSVGGWLYDRVRAGWDVTVLLPQHCDIRPLQILGIDAADLDSWILPASTGCAARGLAVSADMFASDVRIQQEPHPSVSPVIQLFVGHRRIEIRRNIGDAKQVLAADPPSFLLLWSRNGHQFRRRLAIPLDDDLFPTPGPVDQLGELLLRFFERH